MTKVTTDAQGSYLRSFRLRPTEETKKSPRLVVRTRAALSGAGDHATANVVGNWSGSERLVARARVEPRAGPIFRLQCRIPQGWSVERAELLPASLLSDWTVVDTDKSGSLVVIHLNEAIEASQAVTVLLNLSRPPHSPTGGRQTFELPGIDFSPVYSQVTSIGLSVAEQLRVQSPPAGIYWQRPEAVGSLEDNRPAQAHGEKPPWEDHAVWAVASITGRRLRATCGRRLAPRVKVRSFCRVEVAHDQARVGLRMELEPLAGSLQTVDIQLSAPVPPDWQWVGADGRPIPARQLPAWQSFFFPSVAGGWVERLNAIASAQASSQTWRFTLPAPVAGRTSIEKSPTTQTPVSTRTVPLPLRANGVPITGEVELVGFGTGRAVIETHGLVEAPENGGKSERSEPDRLFYDRSGFSKNRSASDGDRN